MEDARFKDVDTLVNDGKNKAAFDALLELEKKV